LFGNESLQELRYDRQVRNWAVRTSLSGVETWFLKDWRDKLSGTSVRNVLICGSTVRPRAKVRPTY